MGRLTKYIATRCIPTRLYLQLIYLWKFRRLPNIEAPTTLNEKLLWKKLYGYKPLHTTITDKYAVREWVADRIGQEYLIPMIAAFETVKELDFERLPESFIIKTSHGSGQNVIIHSKDFVDESQVKRLLRGWLKENHYHLSKEPQYKDIKPRLIVEKLLTDADGCVPMDFKFHCFHGQVEAIQVDIDRFDDHRRNFYDTDWKLLAFTWSAWDRHGPLWPNGRAVERPAALEEMIKVARSLAAEFDYIRVDLFNCDGKVYFGELTLHPGGGWERFDPPEYDRFFGDKLDLKRDPQ
jgi:hypothetical protein